MKSLVATLILFVVLLCSVIANFFFINHVADTMEHMIEGLPPVTAETCVNSAQEIQTYWNDRINLISLSVGYNIIDRVCEQLALLVACAEIQDLYGYQSARALLLDAIEDARRTERFSIGNIL